ncbi:uncharacterized protein LOC129884174 [Solanum dulcamara]|uniref:uncharacterized protein LOC129884174 n=1 Tax=Solanum dulcamara TaxID=45834 RepID=UPI0024856881|nr:uncharacterized protein LOC129884174 [Solanum dulcamara]
MGGQPYNMNKSFDFISVIEACGLTDLGFCGQKFTRCNNRDKDARIWKRLDRAMVNDSWLEIMPVTTVSHLASTGSDHCPLLLEGVARQGNATKYFKFLHCWTDNVNFLSTIKTCWDNSVEGNPMRSFQQKLKRVSNTLSKWSRNEFGDLFASVKEYEEQMVTEEQNEGLQSLPTMEELKKVVFSMSSTSAAGPDGMNGKLYQSCWDIICEDLLRLVQYFFNEHGLPKFISHACLALLPKNEHSNSLSDYRPISLSNYTNKIISKLLSLRITPILPQLISENQSGFVKATSGQLINKDKSQLMMPLNTPADIVERVSMITGYKCTNGPITYLGYPLYIGRQRIIYFTNMVAKVLNRIRGWQTKMLSYEGRVTMVKSVLQSIPIHLVSAISPTKTTMNQIKRLIADFFWGWNTERRKYHWAT